MKIPCYFQASNGCLAAMTLERVLNVIQRLILKRSLMFYNRHEATSMIGLTGEITDSDCSGFDFHVCLCGCVYAFGYMWGRQEDQIPSTLFTETEYLPHS